MKLSVYNDTDYFSNEEILKNPELDWDYYIIIERDFTAEELKIYHLPSWYI